MNFTEYLQQEITVTLRSGCKFTGLLISCDHWSLDIELVTIKTKPQQDDQPFSAIKHIINESEIVALSVTEQFTFGATDETPHQ